MERESCRKIRSFIQFYPKIGRSINPFAFCIGIRMVALLIRIG